MNVNVYPGRRLKTKQTKKQGKTKTFFTQRFITTSHLPQVQLLTAAIESFHPALIPTAPRGNNYFFVPDATVSTVTQSF